jgi:hypothetical protein
VAFAAYAVCALGLRLGPLGLLEGIVVSLVALPFWRCTCGRPARLTPFLLSHFRYLFQLNLAS